MSLPESDWSNLPNTAPRSERASVDRELGAIRSIQLSALRVFVEHRLALMGLGIVVFMVLLCFIGPLFYHTDQIHTNIGQSNRAPSMSHLLGTDDVGYDQLGRLMRGGQISLEVGLTAAAIATTFGVLYGALSGFVGGFLDALLMRIVDVLLAIPTLFFALFLASIFVTNVWILIVVIAFASWLQPARLVRAEALSVRTREYVAAVYAMGGSIFRIILRHVIPNTVGTVVVSASFAVADAILLVSYLSFLGLGVQPPDNDWGGMLTAGVSYIFSGYWWEIYPPGLAIVVTVVAFNLLGDATRDALDVRLQRR